MTTASRDGDEQVARLQPRLKINLLANLGGQGATTLIQFAIVPLYIQLLGPESYGLVGVQTTLQALAQVLDLGVSSSVNREVARRMALGDEPRDIHNVVRTLESGYWCIGLLIGAIIALGAPAIAGRWLRHDSLSAELVEGSVRMMALLVAAQWPLTFYAGALLGLERHAVYNSVRTTSAFVTACGAYFVLTRVAATPVALFAWQSFMALIQAITLGIWTWRCLPHSQERPRIRPTLLKGIWTFAAGMTGITATGLFLSQIDKIVGSRMLPLGVFGFYMLGAALSNTVLYSLVSPVFASLFPRFTSLAAAGDDVSLQDSYRRSWGVMSILTVPAGAALVAFAGPVIAAWTRNPAAAEVAGPVAALLIAGTVINGLMYVPYGLQLARGWTRIALVINVGLCAVALPAALALGSCCGSIGLAALWPAVSLLYAVVGTWLTHRRSGWRMGWIIPDIAAPAVAAAGVVLGVRVLLPSPEGIRAVLSVLTVTWSAAVAAMVVVSPLLRAEALRSVIAYGPKRRS